MVLRMNLFRILLSSLICISLSQTAFAREALSAKVKTAFGGDCETLLLETIHMAKSEILVAVYSFSRAKIASALIDKAKSGVKVKIKMDARQASFNFSKQTMKLLKEAQVDLQLIKMPKYRSMHNKFIVSDRHTVATGSYNFTHAASKDNWENLVQITNRHIANKFVVEWEKIKKKKKR